MALTMRKLSVGMILLTVVIGVALPTIASAERRNHHNQNENNNQIRCGQEEQEEEPVDEGLERRQFNSRNNRSEDSHHSWQKICATAEPATFDPSTCGELGSYTIIESTGVDYMIDGEAVAPGTYTAANGTTVTIVAVAQEGYAFEPEAVTTWTYTFNVPTDCETPQVLSSSTTITPQVTAKPVGGVSAGAGGAATTDSRVALFGLVLSIGTVVFGFVQKINI